MKKKVRWSSKLARPYRIKGYIGITVKYVIIFKNKHDASLYTKENRKLRHIENGSIVYLKTQSQLLEWKTTS